METAKNLFNYMKGYQHVADFQRLCGVEVVELDKLSGQNGNVTDSGSERNGRNTNGLTNRKVQSEYSECKNAGKTNGSYKNGVVNPNRKEVRLAYKINNKPLFYLMSFGAGLGGEIFYILFFPFMLWNIDSRLTRCCLLIWYPLMYFGQFLKDFIQWPRPSPPAVRLEGNRFEMEYGMPSTHTIVGTCIPFTLLVLTAREYEYPYYIGFTIAVVWSLLVACSRVYLGMHTALDCLAGISMTMFALPGMLNMVTYVDYIQVTSPFAPLFSFLIPLLACIYYPKPKVWSITRGDTSNIVSIGAVILLMTWTMYQIGWITESPRSPELQPLPAITFEWVKLSSLRMLLGIILLPVLRIAGKKFFVAVLCKFAGIDTKDIDRQRELGLEVPTRWLVIGGLAFHTAITLPLLFEYLGIQRPGFYSEVGL